MRLDRLLAGLFLATPIACASSPALRADSAPVTIAAPASLASPAALRSEDDLRVMTFNIQSGRHGLDKVAETIRSASPDIVALQEVDVGSVRANGMDQPAELAQRTGLPYYAHFRTTSLYGGDYGVALISRFPLESVEQHPLPVEPGTEPRTVARVLMKVNGQEVSIYVTHLTRRPFNGAVRMRQSAAIMKLLAADPRPKLLMGDMNDTPDSRSLLLLKRELVDVFALRGQGPSDTYPLPVIPNLRIDYVLACDHFMPRHSQVLRVRASDHFPVVADLTLLGPVKAPTVEMVQRPSQAAASTTGSK
ncbi:endonuclease/exonuclease/phosphatase family protein [Archangium violaceum]|uniref:endonuclease/exonuclease/phosphatase family protein n=1 Tax=Archangium violaceum TaxID=83451 RepID=UPI0019524029|nr:endonuclease/exonuclease/phosphatase family protein [Archangium violaceum]QRN98649.1 endonuclease/exonuclease/phosphatase family protein [Archangium violaceum]